MLNVEQIHEWRGQSVVDRDGERIGKLDEVFYDHTTGEATFASVNTGLMGRHSNLVALTGATVGRDYVRVAYTAAEVKRVEARQEDGRLDLTAAHDAATAYGVEFAPDTTFDSATLIADRHSEAAEAAAHAEELRQEALLRADDVEARRQEADAAARNATEAERELDRAQQAARDARDEADRAADNALPAPPNG